MGRRSGESVRKTSGPDMERIESQDISSPGGKDILADLTRLQREIDALRTHSEK
jgi:hypothetical protein